MKGERKESEKRVWALMRERTMIVNRTTPSAVNLKLTLVEANYKHSIRTMIYTYKASDGLELESMSGLDNLLQNRYCNEEEFELLRENDVMANWVYWSRAGVKRHDFTSHACL